jgi:hypothetical protein
MTATYHWPPFQAATEPGFDADPGHSSAQNVAKHAVETRKDLRLHLRVNRRSGMNHITETAA